MLHCVYIQPRSLFQLFIDFEKLQAAELDAAHVPPELMKLLGLDAHRLNIQCLCGQGDFTDLLVTVFIFTNFCKLWRLYCTTVPGDQHFLRFFSYQVWQLVHSQSLEDHILSQMIVLSKNN